MNLANGARLTYNTSYSKLMSTSSTSADYSSLNSQNQTNLTNKIKIKVIRDIEFLEL